MDEPQAPPPFLLPVHEDPRLRDGHADFHPDCLDEEHFTCYGSREPSRSGLCVFCDADYHLEREAWVAGWFLADVAPAGINEGDGAPEPTAHTESHPLPDADVL